MKIKVISMILLLIIFVNLFSVIVLADNEINDINEVVKENTIEENITENNVVEENITDENDVDKNEIEVNNNVVDNEGKEDSVKVTNEVVEDKTIQNEETKKENVENNVSEEVELNSFIKSNLVQNSDMLLDSKVMVKQANTGDVTYRTHIQNIGWQDIKKDGELAGTQGKSLRLEAMNINLSNKYSSLFKIKYQVHVQNIGWQDWKTDGELAGTEGRGLRLEAIKIKLDKTDDYSIMYRVHVQNDGWQDWKTDGELAGTEGRALRLEAIQIKIVPKVVKSWMRLDTPANGEKLYSPSKITFDGWKMSNLYNTKIQVFVDNSTASIDDKLIQYYERPDVIREIKDYGTQVENPKPGYKFTLDASKLSAGKHTITIKFVSSKDEILKQLSTSINIDRNLHIKYSSHIQNIGWQGNKIDGQLSGTSGQGLRLEALKINLVGQASNAKILYRTHVQSIGWQGWQQNGAMAGTSGQNLRIEAIQIKLENMDKYTVEYQVHVQGIGWTDWYIDGETAGTIGQARRIEAIRIRLVPKYKHQYKGIDVSSFNRITNWWAVKNSGIDFAFIRVGIRGYGQAGRFAEDRDFKTNIQMANAVGLPVGVYFVTQATNASEAVEEANWVIERIRNYKISYPVALDIESPGLESPTDVPRTANLDKATRTYLADVFCQTIQNAGYTPIIYTNIDWAVNYLNMHDISQYDTWIAHYKKDTSSGPSYNGKYSIWQYTSSGTVNGILGNVDMNICYKKY